MTSTLIDFLFSDGFLYLFVWEWLLKKSYGYRIDLSLTSLDVESHPNCGYDYVKISNGSFSEMFCGIKRGDSLPGPFSSCSFIIEFSTDFAVNRPGFTVDWTQMLDGGECKPHLSYLPD